MLLRLLDTSDLPGLMRLSQSAGWNQTSHDWMRILQLAPGTSFGIEVDGHLAASSTLICYGDDLAWLGMVLTLPDYQRRGLARQLVERCLQEADSRTVRLDASDQGRPLYLSVGFVDECAIERWALQKAPDIKPPKLPDVRCDDALDAEVFGADRTALLRTMPSGAILSDCSYARHREGREAAYFGPCVSTSIANTRTLLECALSHYQGQPVYWDLFPHKQEVAALACEFGFEPLRHLTRMVRRGAPTLPDLRYHAIAGFEFG